MADTNKMNQNEQNKQNEMNKSDTQKTQGEQGKAGNVQHDKVGGRERERGEFDKNRQEKSAIGGGQAGQNPTGQSGQSPTGQSGEFDKNRSDADKSRSEPTSR